MQISKGYTHRRPRYRKVVSERSGMFPRVELAGISSRELYSLDEWFIKPPTVEVLGEHVEDVLLQAAGKADDLEQAYDTTIGEGVERSSLLFPEANLGGHDVFKATYDEVQARGEVIGFDYLRIYETDVYEAIAGDDFTRDAEIYWTTGLNALTGQEVYTPAELVWFRSGDIDTRRGFFPATSSGLAAGPTVEFALLAGIQELVERDSLMDLWCRQRVPPTIDQESVAEHWPDVYDFLQKAQRGPAKLHLIDFEPEVDIPTIGGMASREDGRFPNFMHGSGANIDLKNAVHQAAIEGTQGWPYVLNLLIRYGTEGLEPDARNDNFEQNVLYYALAEHGDEVDFYYEGETVAIEDQYPREDHPDLGDLSVPEKLELAIERLDEAGWTPIVYDLTTRDGLEAGIRVTRVRCPEAIPLTPQWITPTEHPRFDGADITKKPHPSP